MKDLIEMLSARSAPELDEVKKSQAVDEGYMGDGGVKFSGRELTVRKPTVKAVEDKIYFAVVELCGAVASLLGKDAFTGDSMDARKFARFAAKRIMAAPSVEEDAADVIEKNSKR